MNKKEEKVLRLFNAGYELKKIANYIGFTGNATTKGIEKVHKILADNGINV